MSELQSFRLNWKALTAVSSDLLLALLGVASLVADRLALGKPKEHTYFDPSGADTLATLLEFMPQYFLRAEEEVPDLDDPVPLSFLQRVAEFKGRQGALHPMEPEEYLWMQTIPREHFANFRIYLPVFDGPDILPLPIELHNETEIWTTDDEVVNGPEWVLSGLFSSMQQQLIGKKAVQPLTVQHRGVEYLIIQIGADTEDQMGTVGALITEERLRKIAHVVLMPAHLIDTTK